MAGRAVMPSNGKPRLSKAAAKAGSVPAPPDQTIAFPKSEALNEAASVEFYNGDGVPLSPQAALNANDIREIIRRCDSSGAGAAVDLAKGGTAFILSAVMRENGKPRVYGIASFPVGVVANWLEPIWNVAGRSIWVFDGSAKVVLSSKGGPPSGSSLTDYQQAKTALKGAGTTKSVASNSGETRLYGYAHARVSGWIVLISTPSRTARIPMDIITILLALVLIASVVALLAISLVTDDRPTYDANPPRASGLPESGYTNPPVPQPRPTKQPRPELSGGSLTYDRSLLGRPSSPELPVAKPPLHTQADESPATGIASIQQGLWKCAAVSVRGRSHQKTGQPCQDASYCKVIDGILLVGAVADGAGSASHGGLGARVAAEKAVETLAEHAGNCLRSDDDAQWNRLLFSALEVARGNVAASAAGQNQPTRQLATTLILFVAGPNFIAAAQIGDGAVVFQDKDGEILALTSPQNGEYINSTTFLVSPDAFKSVQQKTWRGGYTSVAAFTDGLQMLALTMPGGSPHRQFFAPLFGFSSKRDANDTARELEQFLRSEKITSRADDDLTLMLAVLMP
jgi:serine/threonine protein phosphatase PrpC